MIYWLKYPAQYFGTEAYGLNLGRNFFLTGLRVFASDAPEPTFWRAEPSFSIFKNEPKRAFKIFQYF